MLFDLIYRESVFPFTLVRPAVRSVMPAGNCTVSSMVSTSYIFSFHLFFCLSQTIFLYNADLAIFLSFDCLLIFWLSFYLLKSCLSFLYLSAVFLSFDYHVSTFYLLTVLLAIFFTDLLAIFLYFWLYGWLSFNL